MLADSNGQLTATSSELVGDLRPGGRRNDGEHIANAARAGVAVLERSDMVTPTAETSGTRRENALATRWTWW